MPPTRPTLNNRSADLLPAPSTSALPFSEVFVAVFSAAASGPTISLSNEIAVTLAHALHQSGPTFVAAFRAENLTARFPAWLFPCFQRCFPALFPAFVSSSALDVASLFSSAAGTLKLPSFCVSLHLSPQALARPFLARWFEAPIFSTVSLHSKSLVCVVQQAYMFGLSHAPFEANLITSGEFE